MKIRGGAEMLYEVPAQICIVMIHHDRFHIIDIKTQGIAEEQNEQQRKGKRQIQAPEIPYQMIKLLASDSLNISESQW
jgi:hypothetical protein